MDKILNMLGIAKKAGLLEIGEESVSATARRGKAHVIFSASDAADASKRHAKSYADAARIPQAELMYSKADLGQMLGRGSPGMMAVTDAGIAASLAVMLAETDEGKYGELSQQLQRKADRVQQRKREAAAHRKNIRTGKRRTMQ